MAVAFENLTNTTYASRTNTVLTAPSGIANGDVLLAVIFRLGGGSLVPDAPTAPAGWTAIGTDLTGSADGFGFRVSCWRKTASGESGNYTFTHTANTTQGMIGRISGANGTPTFVTSNSGTPANTTRTATGGTTTAANTWLGYLGFDWGDNANNETPPTGFTERLDTTILYWADAIQASAGASGDKTNTCNSASGKPRGAWLIALEPASGGGSYSLDANSGSYAIGGTAASLERNRRLSAESSTYAISGTAATLRRGFKTAANSGSYSISGTAASFARAWKAIANSGSYSVAGTVANLEVHRKLVAGGSTYSISGTAAALKHGWAVIASAGSYAISGSSAGLIMARKLAMGGGTYTITGGDATLAKSSDKVVTVDTGVYSINGQDARLSYSHRIMVADGASYQIGGYPVDLFKGLPIPRNSLNLKVRYGGAGFIGDLARMGSDIEVNFPKNEKFKDVGPGVWPDMARQGGDVVE